MIHRLAVTCGAVFAASALLACWATLAIAPAMLTERLRARSTASSFPILRGAPVGTFRHQREIGAAPDPLLGPPDPTVLVSSAWLDLSAGPMRLAVPATGSRPFAIAILDGHGDRIGVARPGVVGGVGTAIVVAGPRWTGTPPRDAALLRANTEAAWIVARFAVAGVTDEEDVRAVQNSLRLTREGETPTSEPSAR